MNRRDFIAALGGATAWPLAAHAQQAGNPQIGFLSPASHDTNTAQLRAFRQGLKEAGYIEDQNVTVAYRFADNQLNRLPELAADLVHRNVNVIVTGGGAAQARAAKEATSTIPIVFLIGEDPVKLGLVASLARPGGNLTGVNFFGSELATKRLDLLRDLLPAATRVAVLVNPANSVLTESTLRDVASAARSTGLQIQVLKADTDREIDVAFATLLFCESDLTLCSSAPGNSSPPGGSN